MSYVKLFESILDSTVWQEDLHVKVVWITMLAMKDIDGVVHASIPGLAKRAGVTTPQCEEALAKFLAPDVYSRTKDNEGRRIEEVDGGWVVLNHDKYRDLLDADDQREKTAARQQRRRDKLVAQGLTTRGTPPAVRHAESRDDVTHNAESRRIRHADPDTDPDRVDSGSGPSLPEPLDLGAIVRAEREESPGRPPSALPTEPPPTPPGTHTKHLLPHQVPNVDRALDAKRSRLTTDAWQWALAMHNTLRVTEGIDPNAQPWTAVPGTSYAPFIELRARVAELLARGDLEQARATIRHRIDVAAASARRDRTLRWFTPSHIWDPKHFAYDAELSVEQAAAPRAGPRASPRGTDDTEPPRRIKRL